MMVAFVKRSGERLVVLKKIAIENNMTWRSVNVDYDDKWWPSLKNILLNSINNHIILVAYLSNDENIRREHEMHFWMEDDNPNVFRINVYRTTDDRSGGNKVEQIPKGEMLYVHKYNEEKIHALLSKPHVGWIRPKFEQ